MAQPEEKKPSMESHDEVRKGGDDLDVDRHLAVEIPATLAHLSPDELVVVNKKATRKLDILLMPALVVLYVLNFLDRNSELSVL